MMYQNPTPQPPMQAMADQMAQQGRFGDSMMVHMNPIEVAGIASLSPTGQLTTNPMTGQPEAFLAALVAPLLGSAFGGTALGALGSILPGALGTGVTALAANAPLASAVGSGLATTAVTGDLKEGLVSGLTGFGIGKAFEAGAKAIAGTEQLAKEAATAAKTAESAKAAALTADPTLTTEALSKLPSVAEAGVADQALKDSLMAAREMAPTQVIRRGGLGEAAKGLLSPAAAAPIAIGEGQRAAMAAQDERDRMFGKRAAEKEQDLRDAQSIVDASIRQVGSDYGIDYSQEYGRDYGTRYASQGGITSVNPADFQRRYAGLQMMGRQPIQMNGGRSSSREYNYPNVGTAGGFGAPAGRQARLRGPVTIKPEELVGTRPGFQPEISYFRQPTEAESAAALDNITSGSTIDPALLQGIGGVGKGGSMGGVSLPARVRAAQDVLAKKSVSTRKRNAARKILDEYEEEGRGGQDYFDAVMASTYGTEYGMQEGGGTTGQMDQSAAMQLIEQVSMALLGRLPEDQAEVVINRFIDEFGSEAFQMLRSQVLESVVPDSQKEGVIRGQGGGMDDEIPGMIGDSQPVAVSPGEFIVPADVVSGIGDGDTNAGVQELEGMMDRVRKERTGTVKQPAPLGANAGGALPA